MSLKTTLVSLTFAMLLWLLNVICIWNNPAWWIIRMSLNDAQTLFGFFFAIYFYMIIDRSHVMYKSWDTYSAWRGQSHSRNRLIAGWLILMILPLTQFAVLFTLLGLYNVTFEPTPAGVVSIILIGISPFFTFGYFRIYEAVIHGAHGSFFSEEEKEQGQEIRPYFAAHFIPGVLYVVISTLLLLITLYI